MPFKARVESAMQACTDKKSRVEFAMQACTEIGTVMSELVNYKSYWHPLQEEAANNRVA